MRVTAVARHHALSQWLSCTYDEQMRATALFLFFAVNQHSGI